MTSHTRVTGLRVHLDLRQMRGEGRRPGDGRGRAAAQHGLVARAELHGQLGQLRDRDTAVRHAAHPHPAVHQLEVLHGRLEVRRGDGQDLSPCLAGGAFHRGPHGVGDLAAAAGAGIGRRVRVGVDHGHVLHGDAGGLGRDLGERRAGPAHVHRAHHDRERAVAVQPADGARRLDAAHPAAHGDARAAAPSAAAGSARGAVARAHLLEPQQALAQADPGPRSPVGHGIALLHGVQEAKLQRVHADGARHLVHLRLDGEGGLDGARRAVGAVAGLVGQHLVAADVEMRHAVVAAEHQTGDAHRGAGEGARVEDHTGAERGERAVAARARRHLDHALGRGRRGEELLRAREDHRDRTPEGHRQRGRQGLEEDELAAEAAAQRRGDHAHAMLGEPQRLGHLGARVEEGLGAGPHAELAHGVHGGHRRARLEIALVDHGGAVAALHDHPRLGEPAGHIPARVVDRAHHIGRGQRSHGLRSAAGSVHGERLLAAAPLPGLADPRRLGAHGLLGIDGRRQFLILHGDEPGRILGEGLGLRHHGRHRVAGEERPLQGQRAAVAIGRVLMAQRQVAAAEDADHAGERGGGLAVDRDDARVRVRAQDEAAVEHAGKPQVRGEAGEAGDLLASVETGQGAADGRGCRHGDESSGFGWSKPMYCTLYAPRGFSRCGGARLHY